MQEYLQPKIGGKIRIFSLARENNILIKKKSVGHRELSIVVNLHERKFLNRYSYFKEMIVVVKRFCQVFNI